MLGSECHGRYTGRYLPPKVKPTMKSLEKSEIIKQISALKYGRKKELVDKEIFYRVGA